VPDQYLGRWWDFLRARSVFLSAGPVLLDAQGDTVRVPKMASGTSVGMVAENAAIPAADPTFAEAVLTPKKAATLTLVCISLEWT
jgi:HK97 family phage major capsid protein